MIALMCLFCRMLDGEVPTKAVAETESSFAFRDIDPQAPSHVLVIPRRHVQNLGELAGYSAELVDLVALAAQVAEDEGLDRGYRLVANTGSQAGQTVHHAHLHVLGGRDLTWPPG
jgi:histidine triad (HIT) family protein